MTNGARTSIVADGRERLEAAIAALPAEERAEAARRAGVGTGKVWAGVGRAWPGRRVPPSVVRWLRQQWGTGDRRRFGRTPVAGGRRPEAGRDGER